MILCLASDSMKTAASTIARRVLEAMGHVVVCESEEPPMAFACRVCNVNWTIDRFGIGYPVFILEDDRAPGYTLCCCGAERELVERGAKRKGRGT